MGVKVNKVRGLRKKKRSFKERRKNVGDRTEPLKDTIVDRKRGRNRSINEHDNGATGKETMY